MEPKVTIRHYGKNSKHRVWKELGLCPTCGNEKLPIHKYCVACRFKARRQYFRRKKMVIHAYGGKCECCGVTEIEFLAIDHINGDGYEHRKSISSGKKIYYWLVENKFPEGFRLLCHNCNFGIYVRGKCPGIGHLGLTLGEILHGSTGTESA